MRRISIIDLGTNTFHLMVLEIDNNTYVELRRERRVVRLGKEGMDTRIISDKALNRAIKTLVEYKKISNDFFVTDFHLIGTSMLRTAKNKKLVLQKIKEETKLDVRLISGDREAFYIHKGVINEVEMTATPDLIMDIGGGSVEFILCNEKEILFQKSYEIGIQRLTNLFLKSDPLQAHDVKNLFLYLDEELKSLFDKLKKINPKRLIGSAGSFSSLWALFSQKEKVNVNISRRIISLKQFNALYEEILLKSLDERLSIDIIPSYQAEMINISFSLIKKIITESCVQCIEVSSSSLKEGVMHSILEKCHE